MSAVWITFRTSSRVRILVECVGRVYYAMSMGGASGPGPRGGKCRVLTPLNVDLVATCCAHGCSLK